MDLDFDFALSLLPLAIVGVIFLGFGGWLDERARQLDSRLLGYPAKAVIWIGIAVLGLGALAIVGNLFSPLIFAAYCLFADFG